MNAIERPSTVTHQFRVGDKYTCTMTVPIPAYGSVVGLAARWSPRPPSKLSGSALRQYRRGRNDALAEVARQMGGPVVVVEA